MYVMYGPSAEKKKKNGPCREVTVKEETPYTDWNPWGNTTEYWRLLCLPRHRYAVFRKLPHSRNLYLCMNSASRIFFSASFLSVYEVVRTAKKNLRGWLVYIAHQHRTPNEWSKKLCELVSGHKRLTKNSAGNKFLFGRWHYMTTLLNLYFTLC